MKKKILSVFGLILLFCFASTPAYAHEVYVLSQDQIQSLLQLPSPNPFMAIFEYPLKFAIAGVVTTLLLAVVFFFSVSNKIEKIFDPVLKRIKPYALFTARIALGLSLAFSAYHNSLFGPEITLKSLFGDYAVLAQGLLFITGVCITLGLVMRIATVIAFLFVLIAVFKYGFYITTYASYAGDIIILVLLKTHLLSFDRHALNMTGKKKSLLHKFHPNDNISFFVFRLFFGVSLVYSSLYAKFFHSNLALTTINEYHLTDIFPFPPMFFLLGALLIEIMIGVFFIIGFEVRFTSIFFMIFLILSLLYFKEDVWPHFILIGTNLAIFLHGYDKYTLERFVLKKKGEPVL